MESKDGSKTPSKIGKENIETWTSQQIEYLHRRRATFKGAITKNSKKAKDIISKKGSRTLSEEEDIADSVREYLESRVDKLPLVIGEFSDAVSELDDMESRNPQKFVELLSKSAQSKRNKSAPKFSNKDYDSVEKGSEEDELDKDKLNSKDFDRLFKGIKKPALTVFSGDKDFYHDWRAQFEIFANRMKVPAKTKMMMLKNSLSGEPSRDTHLDNIKLPWRNLSRST
ncbi:unnamed protein product [Pocillopora meandrina]|uniref:Uncharacterized protein n=1 Tax=Pocillopora meandrina TaxID=46732 RepID=A0AAU9W3S2_9CNID|nr:unnamed protein product [Pocillopora meandrina]